MPHLHLILNHIPIVGTLAVLLFLLWGIVSGSRDLQRAAFVGALVIALATGLVFYTGDEAADALASAPWFSKELLERHDQRAGFTLGAALVMGTLAGFAIWLSNAKQPVRPLASWLVAAGLVVTLAFGGWTAFAGAVIRHEEIRPKTTSR